MRRDAQESGAEKRPVIHSLALMRLLESLGRKAGQELRYRFHACMTGYVGATH